VQDISAFLDHNLHAVPRGAVNVRATYVDSCHLRHGQRIIDEPRRLLKTIPGLELVELARPDWCCGSAGVYNILHTNTANTVLDYKMTDVAATAADSIVTTNPGCQMQLLYGVRRSGLDAEVVHLVQLLDRSYTTEGQA
jgi:glycolate oxidase iron-sulfur subunit